MNEYPDGKIFDNDLGQTEVKVGDYKGRVVIQFEKSIAALAMPPQQALDLAGLMILRARSIATEPIILNLESNTKEKK